MSPELNFLIIITDDCGAYLAATVCVEVYL